MFCRVKNYVVPFSPDVPHCGTEGDQPNVGKREFTDGEVD